jgi:hypothetical protein
MLIPLHFEDKVLFTALTGRSILLLLLLLFGFLFGLPFDLRNAATRNHTFASLWMLSGGLADLVNCPLGTFHTAVAEALVAHALPWLVLNLYDVEQQARGAARGTRRQEIRDLVEAFAVSHLLSLLYIDVRALAMLALVAGTPLLLLLSLEPLLSRSSYRPLALALLFCLALFLGRQWLVALLYTEARAIGLAQWVFSEFNCWCVVTAVTMYVG